MKDKERIIPFCGPFKKLCYKYILYKRSLGYHFGTAFIYSIRNMDRFFKSYHFDRPRLTKETVLSFTAYRENESLKTQHMRMSLIRMLYGCGLRISEAPSLKVSDANLKDGILTITKSKFNKSRLIPMSESLTKILTDYAAKMNFSIKENGYFFPAPDKGKYNRHVIYKTFKDLLKEASVVRIGYASGPHLHDLHHIFAVHSLEKMVGQGIDIYCSLPILCTYLGHRGIESSQKYLRLTIQSFSSVTGPLENLYKDVFPEVNTNDKRVIA